MPIQAHAIKVGTWADMVLVFGVTFSAATLLDVITFRQELANELREGSADFGPFRDASVLGRLDTLFVLETDCDEELIDALLRLVVGTMNVELHLEPSKLISLLAPKERSYYLRASPDARRPRN